MGTIGCRICGQDVPGASLFPLSIEALPDVRARWTWPAFYGAIVHECPVEVVVAEAEAILRAAFVRLNPGHQ